MFTYVTRLTLKINERQDILGTFYFKHLGEQNNCVSKEVWSH